MAKFILKKIQEKPYRKRNLDAYDIISKKENLTNENNINKKENIMTQDEKINLAQSLLDDVKGDGKKYKRVKKNSGLIERTEESKIILNEDNKQLLKD